MFSGGKTIKEAGWLQDDISQWLMHKDELGVHGELDSAEEATAHAQRIEEALDPAKTDPMSDEYGPEKLLAWQQQFQLLSEPQNFQLWQQQGDASFLGEYLRKTHQYQAAQVDPKGLEPTFSSTPSGVGVRINVFRDVVYESEAHFTQPTSAEVELAMLKLTRASGGADLHCSCRSSPGNPLLIYKS